LPVEELDAGRPHALCAGGDRRTPVRRDGVWSNDLTKIPHPRLRRRPESRADFERDSTGVTRRQLRRYVPARKSLPCGAAIESSDAYLADLLNQAAAPTGKQTPESKKYLEEFAGLLQRLARERHPRLGRLESILRDDPTFQPPPKWARDQPKLDALKDVERGFQAAPRNLIGLELYRPPSSDSPEPGLHRVNVYGYEETPRGGYRLYISDVNIQPDDPRVNALILEFDAKADHFIVRDATGPILSARTGRPKTYSSVRVVHDPPRDPQMWRALDMFRRRMPINDIREALGYPTQRTMRERFDRALAEKNTKLHNHLDYAKEKLGKWLTATIDKVNGVSLYYDADLFEGVISEQEVSELLKDIKRFAKENEEGAYQVSLLDRREELHLVALDTLLETKAATLGNLTRVRGYVQDETGRLFLVGQIEKNREPIPLDLFSASLRSVWKEGMFPFISIDPDPMRIHSPHVVRIGGIPNDLRDSEFVRILVDADYLMKRLILGRTASLVKGFQSLPDLVRDNPDASRELRARAWLTPRAIPVAGILETRRGKASAVLFESEVDVLSENQRQIGMFLIGADDADPLVAEVACILTRYFPELEDVHLPFRKLHTVFDLTKLCAIWRQRGVTAPALEQLARRPVAKADFPKTFEAIVVPEGDVVIFGGAMTRQPPARAAVETDKLRPLLEAAARPTMEPEIAVGEISLPRTLELRGTASVPANGEMQLYLVKKHLAQAEYREALELLNYILVQSASDPPPEALAYRAALLIFLRRYEEALVDVERALPAFPQLVALRGCARACLGDQQGAARDAEASAARFADDAAVAAWNFATYMELLDLDRADSDLRRLELLFPGHPILFGLRVQLDTFRRLGVEKARERQRQLRSLPPEIVAHVMRGAAPRSKPAEAMLSLERALALCLQSSAPAVKELAVAERCRFGLIWANAQYGSPAGLEYAAQMIAEHPVGRAATSARRWHRHLWRSHKRPIRRNEPRLCLPLSTRLRNEPVPGTLFSRTSPRKLVRHACSPGTPASSGWRCSVKKTTRGRCSIA
jgi:tetratricopeptide (TPR) repeat protein